MNNFKRKESLKETGITLVALVVTIIVLLILAGVTLTLALSNNGVMDRAQYASNTWANATKDEETAMGQFAIDVDSLTEGFINREENGGVVGHDWQRNGDELICAHCNKTLYIGKVTDYRDDGEGETSILTSKSGYSENQYLSDDDHAWVVLGIEDNDGDSKYETLLLTTEKPTSDMIELYGAVAYNNWMSEADRMAKELYGNKARAITIEDVNNCLLYEPTGARYLDSNYNTHTVNNYNTQLRSLTDIWNSTSGIGTTTLTPDGSILGNNYLTDYSYHITEATNASTVSKDMIFGNLGWNYYYHLNTKGISANSNYAAFGLGGVMSWCVGNTQGWLYTSDKGDSGCRSLFRAVIGLTSEIPNIVRDGDYSTTYGSMPD